MKVKKISSNEDGFSSRMNSQKRMGLSQVSYTEYNFPLFNPSAVYKRKGGSLLPITWRKDPYGTQNIPTHLSVLYNEIDPMANNFKSLLKSQEKKTNLSGALDSYNYNDIKWPLEI